MSYFFLTEYHHSWVGPTLYVVNTTDVACHLWLYWTADPMRVHKRTTNDRGLSKLADPDYCFVGWTRIEQNEAGDTLEHTFDFGPWAHCNWRWWVFRGQIAGEWSSSLTCIFTAHYESYIKDESNRHIDLSYRDPGGYIDHAVHSITPVKLQYPFTFPEFPRTPADPPTQDYQVSNKQYVDDTMAEAVRVYRENYPFGTWPIVHIGWWTWDLSAHVPANARYVEIVHYNSDPIATLNAGSRKPGSLLNRVHPLFPGGVFKWYTELSPALAIEVFAQADLMYFNLMGYYT